ncbi:hypothetical protein [Chromobacterium amazonense]|uniref:hypothetical protein n=1 Tax=Chromobacterium amazonense TaxID=1382803 RepID=UPI00166FEC34|nr:hypothetical protein [Chromobacterium amazonense]
MCLDFLRSSPPDFHRIIELTCYVETAWQGATHTFKSPPKLLSKARVVLEEILGKLNQSETVLILSPEQWGILRDAVLCADSVWTKLPLAVLQQAMDTVRSYLKT